jgi:hypothetical protein
VKKPVFHNSGRCPGDSGSRHTGKRASGDALEVAGTELCESAYGVAGTSAGVDASGESYHHGKRGEHCYRRERQAGDEDRVLGIFPRWAADHLDDVDCGMGMAGGVKEKNTQTKAPQTQLRNQDTTE